MSAAPQVVDYRTIPQPAIKQGLEAERCRRNPLYWAQNHTCTENPKWKEQGREFKAPFPQKSYFRPVFDALAKYPRLFLPKSREMLTSWSVMIWATHRAQWYRAQVIVQTDSEEKAKELVGYSACLYRNQDKFLLDHHPLDGEVSSTHIGWASGGEVFGIPKGANKIRMYHPTVYVMDEVAFLPEARECYDAAQPVAAQIVGISSAGPGWFGDECS